MTEYERNSPVFYIGEIKAKDSRFSNFEIFPVDEEDFFNKKFNSKTLVFVDEYKRVVAYFSGDGWEYKVKFDEDGDISKTFVKERVILYQHPNKISPCVNDIYEKRDNNEGTIMRFGDYIGNYENQNVGNLNFRPKKHKNCKRIPTSLRIL